MSPFAVTAHADSDRVVRLAVAGEVDSSTQAPLREAILGAIGGRTSELLVDLAATTFLDSGGIGVLIEGHDAARRAGTDFRVINPADGVHRVLAVSGVLATLAGQPSA